MIPVTTVSWFVAESIPTKPAFDLMLGNQAWLSYVIAASALLIGLTMLSYWKSPMALPYRFVAIALRSIGLGILLMCLLEPMASLERPKPQANVFAVVVDRSKSVDVLLQEQEKQGNSAVRDLFRDDAEWQRRLADDFRVRRYTMDNSAEAVDTFEGLILRGNESSLYGSLQSLSERFEGRPLAGVILLSDGQATDRRPDGSSSRYGFPIYPISMGNAANARDIRIESATTTQSDFETSPVTIQAKISHTGFSGSNVVVDLIDSENKTIQSQTTKLKQDNAPVVVEFRFRPDKPGVRGYRVVARAESEHPKVASTEPMSVVKPEAPEAVPSTAELTLGNNQRFQVVDRGHGPYRILYMAGRPNWEYKFLKRSLDEDDEIRLTSLIRIARKEPKFNFRDSKVDSANPLFSGFEDISAEEKEQYDEPVFARLGLAESTELKRGFPKDAEELFEYSAIIIDDMEHDFFTPDQQSMLRQFVSIRGGGLLMLGGQESMRGRAFKDSVLSQMLPVYGDDGALEDSSVKSDQFDLSGPPVYRYQLTREGWLQPFLRLKDGEVAEKSRLDTMPGFEVLNRTKGIKPGATVFANVKDPNDKDLPVLITQRFGKGRTAAFMIGDMWRWGLKHEGTDAAPLYQSWRQMVRWLISDVPKPIQMRLDESTPNQRSVRLFTDVKNTEFKSIDNSNVEVTILDPNGTSTTAKADASANTAGRYESAMVAEQEGVYSATADVQASDGSKLGVANLGWVYEPSAREFQSVGEDVETLNWLAKDSGGEVIPLRDLESFVSNLESRKVPVTETKIYPLWHQGWVLLVALLCICGEWGMRRRYGMA